MLARAKNFMIGDEAADEDPVPWISFQYLLGFWYQINYLLNQ